MNISHERFEKHTYLSSSDNAVLQKLIQISLQHTIGR